MKCCDLLSISIEGAALSVKVGPVLIVIGALVALASFLLWLRRFRQHWKSYDVVKATIPFIKGGSVEIHPNHETIRIAYQAWVELATRKAALPFDEEHDVIVEVYDSWYDLFTELRLLAKSVPAHRLRECRDTRKLVEIMIRVLNEGLRPHLTQWQAKFRRWYETAIKQADGKTPQAVQREYAEYGALVADLKRVNAGIVKYADWLRRISEGNTESSIG